MPKISKRMTGLISKVEKGKLYPVDVALDIIKSFGEVKFKESVDVAIQLGIDAKKSDQTVRGSLVLPEGTGKKLLLRFSLKAKKLKRQKRLEQKLLEWRI